METIPNANLGSAVVAQAYVSRLDRYVPECEPVSLRGSRTSSNVPVYRLRPRKSRHSAGQEVPALANRLRKNLPSADNDRIIQVLSDWRSGTKSQSCVWISQALQADLNLPMKTRKPDCAYLQLLYISEDRPFIILTLYKDNDVDEQASQDSVKHFTTVMSQLLASSLSNFCHCDFALLPCTLQWDALSTEVLDHEVNKQLKAIQKFYSGPKNLTKGTFTELRNAIEAVAGVTTVPALTESPSSRKRWLLLLKDDWRDTVSLLIEMLVQRDHEHPLNYTDESEFKMHVAALEAAKRLSFSSKVLIVTSPDGLHSQVLKCAGELVRQTEEEEERKVDLQVTTETAAADYVIYIDIPVDKIDRPSLTLVKRAEEFRLLLLGKTGTGRSTTGNTLLQQKRFECDRTKPLSSVTRTCSVESNTVDGRKITVMDSPGMLDTDDFNSVVFTIIDYAATVKPGFDAIIYTLEIGRFTTWDLAVYERLKAVFGDGATNYIIIVFTHGDELNGNNFEDVLAMAPPDLRRVLRECGDRYVVFDNTPTAPRKQTQVEELLAKIRQMRVENEGQPYACPQYSDCSDEQNAETISKRLDEVRSREIERIKLCRG